jgi:hypothetical protein
MAEIINLRRVRKAKDRDARAQKAAENRHQFGLTKAEKTAEQARRDKAERGIEGHRREPSDSET